MLHRLECRAFLTLSVNIVHILQLWGKYYSKLCVYTTFFKVSLWRDNLKIISALHINSLNCCQQNIHSSLFIRINLHAYGAMGNETVNLCWGSWQWCSNEWLSHPWDAVCDCDLQLVVDTLGWYNETRLAEETGERRTQIKLLCWAAGRGSLSCLQERGGGGEFWEAELRVNSICRKTTTATTVLPHQVALLKCKALLLQRLTEKPWVIKSKIHYMHHYST